MADSPKLLGLPVVLDPSVPVGEIRIERQRPQSCTPPHGTRVTVGGVTWTWDKDVEAWEHEDLRLRAHDALFPYLTSRAEMEAEVAQLVRLSNDAIAQGTKLAVALARYAAIGKEAVEHVSREYPSNTLFNHAAQGVVDTLAAKWRAQQTTPTEDNDATT